jgi:hypothetical protein
MSFLATPKVWPCRRCGRELQVSAHCTRTFTTFYAHRQCPHCRESRPLAEIQFRNAQATVALLMGAFAIVVSGTIAATFAFGVERVALGWVGSSILILSAGLVEIHLAFLWLAGRSGRAIGAGRPVTPRDALWERLLVARGYRPDQLIFCVGGGAPLFSLAHIADAVALVQNPGGFDLNTPDMLDAIGRRIELGTLPHHLVALNDGGPYLDREGVDFDNEEVARELQLPLHAAATG